MAVLHFPPESFLELGLNAKGFSAETIKRTGHKTNLERCQAFYYATPEVSTKMFDDLQTTDDVQARIKKPNPHHFLLALNFLKEYPTKYGLAAFLDSTEKTGLKWSEEYVKKIAALATKKIEWVFDDPQNDEICPMTGGRLSHDRRQIVP